MTARQGDKSVVSYEEIPCQLTDALALFDAGPSIRGWTVLHTDARRDRTMVSLAESPTLSTSGPRRFADAKACMNNLRARFPEGIELPAAFCFAGFAEQAFETGSAWAGWPNLAIFFPTIMVVEDSSGVRAFQRSDTDSSYTRSLAALLRGETSSANGQGSTGTDASRRPSANRRGIHGLLKDTDAARGSWIQLVKSALSEIEGGVVDKLVPARERTGTLDLGRRWALSTILSQLRAGMTSSTLYCVQSPDGQAFLGASPELLVRKTGTRIESMALAGTAERASSSEERATLHDEKNQREHRVVREEIVASLERAGARATAPAAPESTDFGTIQHLKTVIHAVGEPDTHVFDLVSSLHPTPAVSGAPSEPSQRWLAEHESLERGYYAGPFGFVDSSGDGEFHVALRCALLDATRAHIYAGAGVVAGSEPHAEWDETGWKLSTIAEVLAAEDADE